MNNNYENLPAVLNANQLAAALGISRAGAYQLLNTATFPTLRIGKRLLVPKDKLIDWIERNTGGGHVGGYVISIFIFLSASKSTLIITLYRFGLYKTIGLTGTDCSMFQTV